MLYLSLISFLVVFFSFSNTSCRSEFYGPMGCFSSTISTFGNQHHLEKGRFKILYLEGNQTTVANFCSFQTRKFSFRSLHWTEMGHHKFSSKFWIVLVVLVKFRAISDHFVWVVFFYFATGFLCCCYLASVY